MFILQQHGRAELFAIYDASSIITASRLLMTYIYVGLETETAQQAHIPFTLISSFNVSLMIWKFADGIILNTTENRATINLYNGKGGDNSQSPLATT